MGDVSPRLLEYQERVKRQHWHGKGYIPSVDAPHHPDNMVFPRVQSAKMAGLAWEREPVWHSWLAGLAASVFVAIVILMALAL